MRILLVDTTLYYPASPMFLEALEQLAKQEGYEFTFVDEARFLRPVTNSLMHKVAYRLLGRRPLTYWAFNGALLEKARCFHPDIVLVVKGAYISPNTLRLIKKETRAFLINYATDDPFNPLANTRDLVNGISYYDLYACTKRAIMDEVQQSGCKKVIHVHFGYKPSVHFSEEPNTLEEKARFASDVVFVGNCDQERLKFFETMVHRLNDIRIAFYGGSYWNCSSMLRRHYRGTAMGRDYRLALSGTKIALHLLRHTNQDSHSLRTFEIPACGAFMLAERSDEHLKLFEEGKEMAFFSSPEELVDKVRYYLAHDEERQMVAEAGCRKVTGGKYTYLDRLEQILQAVDSL